MYLWHWFSAVDGQEGHRLQLLHWTRGSVGCIWVAAVGDHFEEMGGDCSGATPLCPPKSEV